MSPIKPGHASGRDAVFWSDKMNEYLIDSLLHHQAIGNRGEGKFFSAAYNSIITGVGERFGVVIDRSNIKNRLKYIKESFNECKNLFGDDSRIKWCSESRRFNADPNVLLFETCSSIRYCVLICNAGANSPRTTTGVAVLGAQQAPEGGAFIGHPDLIDPLADNDFGTVIENLPVFITDDPDVASAKFENEIDLALQELKKSQEEEYWVAEQKLYAQKDRILRLYRHLESERAELADPMPLSDASNYGAMLADVLSRVNQVKREEEKFKSMLKVSGGFAKAPESVTKDLFGLPVDK